MDELPLSKANRLKVAQAFRTCPRRDFSIDCVIEGQLGRVYVDDLENPASFCLNIGPFWYFAGEALSPGGQALLQNFPAYNLFMPSTDGWMEAAQACFELTSFDRYSFSSEHLNLAHLEGLLQNSQHGAAVAPISSTLAARLASLPDPYFEISDFDSADDFVERSLGYAALDGETIMGVAYGSLVCSQGIEVSLYVEEAYRQRGVATALAARLLVESLRRGLRPNWDAANPESCKLALKLGYTYTGSYDAYYHKGKV